MAARGRVPRIFQPWARVSPPLSNLAPASVETVRQRVVVFVFLTAFLDLIGFGIILPLLPFYVDQMGG